MATPRYKLIAQDQAHFYHLVSRCVRQSFLCGKNFRTRKDYSHRKQWFVERVKQLGSAFAVEVFSYTIMSNHFHLVVHYDPLSAKVWSPEEVVDRWITATPCRNRHGEIDPALNETLKAKLLQDRTHIESLREKLSCLSTFMKMLKQPIARRANKEDNCKGHFFEQRFYSAALLDEQAVIAAMAYVDLNPIRAKIARLLSECRDTSTIERLAVARDEENLNSNLAPIVSGLQSPTCLSISVANYVEHLHSLVPHGKHRSRKMTRWRQQIKLLSKHQRAYGSENRLSHWLANRGMQHREIAMPSQSFSY